ncbi:MAG: peptidoglycan DD-metalloendopeptidase family protein [Vicinamibacterales bacterium]
MVSRRYTVVVADRTTGVVRRFTFSLRPTVTAVVITLALPILIGLGARWSATTEIGRLQAGITDLRLENTSFRAATGELTTQLASLQTAITELTERSELDPVTKQAVDRLPALVKARAVGGASASETESRALLRAAMTVPGDTFGVLRGLLSNLESRLQVVRGNVEQREALAAAAPSIWPALGWITSGFGLRSDPFTGNPALHFGLDISTDRGKPVYSTADGRVSFVGPSGEYGNLVIVDHDFGLETRYAHLSGFAAKQGDEVKRGTVVGYVGNTGRTTSTHLHYEVWVNGRPINPLGLLVARPDATQ